MLDDTEAKDENKICFMPIAIYDKAEGTKKLKIAQTNLK
jgi:hypothetical protein